MNIRVALSVVVIGLLCLAGCAEHETAAVGVLPNPVINDALRSPGNRDITILTGLYFKVHSDNKADVIASLNLRNWVPASKVWDSSGSEYRASLPYGPAYPQVWVRVYGINSEYSEPVLVHN